MNLRSCNGLLVILAAILAVDAEALTPAQDLVQKMSASARHLSYKGYFIYERGQQSTAYQIVHRVDDAVEKQRLLFLDGPAFEIINDGHSLKCLHSGDVPLDSHSLSLAEANPVAVPDSALNAIWQNYTVTITGESRVANRAVTQVRLEPADYHRYAYVFAVDNETGLMLKMMMFNAQNQLLERFHYVAVDYNGITEQDLHPQIKDFVEVTHSPPVNDAVEPANAWQLMWVPAGFLQEKTKMRVWRQEVRGQQVAMYSDGLSAFSVFVEPLESTTGGDISTQSGSTSAVSHMLKANGKFFLVTVVGEIPVMTARQIALSVKPVS